MLCIVTISESSTNYADEFLGIWDTKEEAEAWFDSEYSWSGSPYKVHIENDMSWVGSHRTALQLTRIYHDPLDRLTYVNFILPNS